MARRIRWQIVIAALSALLVAGLLGRLALRTASVASPLAGGSYSEALIGAPLEPIPLLNDPLADPAGRAVIALIFDGLVRVGADGLLEPGLAESYASDPSGEVYTFRLRPGLTWHDGAPLGADDVVFTLRTLQTLEEPGDPALARLWQDALVDRIDDLTVRVTLTTPFAPFPSFARVPILPAHLLSGIPPEQWLSSPFAARLVGSGPFQLAELREDRAVLRANPSYYGGRPYLDEIELRFIASPEAALAALLRGDIGAYGARMDSRLAAASLPPGTRLASAPLDEYATLSFNTRQGPLSQPALRRALAHGLSHDGLIERALGGLAAPLTTPLLPGWWAADPELQWYAPDPALAGQLLGELGYEPGIGGVRERDGRPLELELIVDGDPSRLAAAEEIARQWAAIGVGVQVAQVDAETLVARLRSGDFAMAVHSWSRLGPDPDPYALWHSSQADGGLNYAGLEDAEIDTLLESARAESELAARSADYAAFQRRWVDLVPAISLYQPLYLFAVDAGLGGLGIDDPESPGGWLLFGPEDRYRLVPRWYTDSYREIQGDLQ